MERIRGGLYAISGLFFALATIFIHTVEFLILNIIIAVFLLMFASMSPKDKLRDNRNLFYIFLMGFVIFMVTETIFLSGFLVFPPDTQYLMISLFTYPFSIPTLILIFWNQKSRIAHCFKNIIREEKMNLKYSILHKITNRLVIAIILFNIILFFDYYLLQYSPIKYLGNLSIVLIYIIIILWFNFKDKSKFRQYLYLFSIIFTYVFTGVIFYIWKFLLFSNTLALDMLPKIPTNSFEILILNVLLFFLCFYIIYKGTHLVIYCYISDGFSKCKSTILDYMRNKIVSHNRTNVYISILYAFIAMIMLFLGLLIFSSISLTISAFTFFLSKNPNKYEEVKEEDIYSLTGTFSIPIFLILILLLSIPMYFIALDWLYLAYLRFSG